MNETKMNFSKKKKKRKEKREGYCDANPVPQINLLLYANPIPPVF
jgi:hypothetical protein